MFANFAAKRHLTGPLRAVSPVETDEEIDWQSISKPRRSSRVRRAIPQPSASNEKLSQYVKHCFKRQLDVKDVGWKEALQLAWVESVSLLIPLLYMVTVLALLSLAIWFFAEPVMTHVIEERLWEATVWTCGAVAMLGLLYVLLAPLFGGFQRYHGRVLEYHEAPALFDLVNVMSERLQVKAPRRIEINNETAMRVDAYAGINSIYRDEYKIIIGAPLLMSMSLPELTAMLAHELSHFQNKHKKIAFYLIHHVSEWLYYRAKGRDKRHQKLLKRMQSEKLAKYEYAELWVWQRLHLFQQTMFAGMFALHRRLTSWKCRQIELETDALAVQFSGSKAFIAMLNKLRLIQYSQSAVSKQNDWAWKEGFLLDDYASAVALEVKKATKLQFEEVKENRKKECTRFCPDDLTRMTQAQAMKVDSEIKANVSAHHLVEQGKKLSKELTVLDYESTGIESPERFCISFEKIRQIKTTKEQLRRQAQTFFDGRIYNRVIRFEPTEERDVSNFDVQTSIDYIRRYRVEDHRANAAANNLLKRINEANVVERLRASGLPIKKFLGNKAGSKKQGAQYLQYMRDQYRQSLYHLEAMDQVFYQRVHAGKMYLDSKSRAQIDWSFHSLELYSQMRRSVANLEEAYLPLNFIVNGLQDGVTTRILQAGVVEKQYLWTCIRNVRKEFKVRPIKVQLNNRRVHILGYLDFKLGALPTASSDMTLEEMAEYASELIQLLRFQYHKWQDQIAAIMARFEHQNDVAPINLMKSRK
ncbi:M48 family metalloprotease [Bermanella marisrubri]|uniref:Zn-dependent protease with chaperone function n=1 Tax=Bermanella marisrubri TaxID=207949 RepID=Q1N6N1_9GAMM|nr:M48 family metallopeptidase [Bermanella marisrubri]EAT13561.1 Zn-dependent protease with chaperone function [Oceanobacter sp. RED65] [Bermanella marisrubri]QIZ84355.1 M48 family metalloprotease [Bermanella marisrubri]